MQNFKAKGSGPPPKKVVFDLGASANVLTTNKDGTLMAVAGRKLFKIVRVTPTQFEKSDDLRNLPQKQLNLNYSSVDVKWNLKEETQLASAPTNGSVVLWDINKKTKSKIACVFEASEFTHQRAVNQLCYHPKEANIILSGSQDHTMCCFDTRQNKVAARYKGPDSVRDVKYSPHNDNYFSALFDSGVCQIWDKRHAGSVWKQFSVHSGPAYSCAWHPTMEHWIATSGRDKKISVHDIQGTRNKDIHTINALYSVARVSWRPSNRCHITSCSRLLDNVVAVWDVRRPFIPYAAFDTHTDDVTDFVWLSEDVLVSCSKDCKLIQQVMGEATHPAERATPVSMSLRPDGAVAQTCHTVPSTTNSSSSRNPIHFRRTDGDSYKESFLLHSSFLQEHTSEQNEWSNQFRKCAMCFKLDGLPMDKLCDFNYEVCKSVGKADCAQTWLLLKQLYCGSDPQCSKVGLLPIKPLLTQTCEPTEQPVSDLRKSNSECVSSEVQSSSSAGNKLDPPKINKSMRQPTDGGEGEPEIELSDFPGMLEFFETDYKEEDTDSSTSGGISQPREWELPKEPFQLRQDLDQKDHSLDDHESDNTSQSGAGTASAVSQQPSQHTSTSHSLGSRVPQTYRQSKNRMWDFSSVVYQMLKHYAEKGDVQMSVSTALVLKDHIMEVAHKPTVVQWFLSYIDLLNKHQLVLVAAHIIKLCPLPDVRNLSQNSTTFNRGCGNCSKPVLGRTVSCQKCEKKLAICSLCHCPVKGLYSWCELCGHGGHMQHMREWFTEHASCPSGCGHDCIVTS